MQNPKVIKPPTVKGPQKSTVAPFKPQAAPARSVVGPKPKQSIAKQSIARPAPHIPPLKGPPPGKPSLPATKGKAQPTKPSTVSPKLDKNGNPIKPPKKSILHNAAPPVTPKKSQKDSSKSIKLAKEHLLVGEEAKRAYSNQLMTALLPVRLFATLFGQFPLTYKKDKKNGTFTFKYSPYHINSIYFWFIAILSYYCLIVGGWNLYVTIVNVHEVSKPKYDELEERWYEKSLFHRHTMWVTSCIAAVVQTCCSVLYLFKNRHYTPTVFTFYSKVVQQLHMDISSGVFLSTLVIILIYTLSTVAIILMGIFRFTPVTVGTPTLFGVYMFRLFLIKEGMWINENTDTRITIQLMGAFCLILIFTCSKVQIFMFLFHCKILKNAFACWNGRAYITLMKGGKYSLTQEGKLTFQLLYKDHCVILDMLEAVNRLCSGVMEVYYGTQAATIFFEVYFAIRTTRYGTDKELASEHGGAFFIRPNDWIPGFFLVMQTLSIALYTSKVAAGVGQEAMAGLDIVRRKTMLNRKTDDELLFQLSMQASFNSFQRFDISGGGYQYINIDWIMSYINNVAGYFIILYQFQPVMDQMSKGETERRENLGGFLSNLEGFPKDNYKDLEPKKPQVYE